MKYIFFVCFLWFYATGLVFAQTSQFAKNGEAIIHYRVFGKGEPLLIINGGPGLDSDGFVYLAEKLSKHSRCIIYDQRGLGKSKLPRTNAESITIDNMAEDIEALRKTLKIKTWSILGHSFGGIMAAYYAHKYPQSINKLIFSSSGGMDLSFLSSIGNEIDKKLSQQERDSLNYWSNKIEVGDTSYQTRLARAKILAVPYLQNRAHIPTLAERLTRVNYAINAWVFESLEALPYDYSQKFASFKRPVLVLHGRQDVLLPSIAEKTASAFPNARLVFMDNTAHYGWLDSPDLYFGEIEAFLKMQK